jgi:hypothetical protein
VNDNTSAVSKLEGLVLGSNWKVVKLLKRKEDHTGGNFSTCYLVQGRDGEAFLKAFDFSYAFSVADSMDVLRALINAYVYERDLLEYCHQKKLRKVVVAVDHGEVQVPGYTGPAGRVYYLIFHLANGDVRGQVSQNQRFDTIWSLRALHDIAVGLSPNTCPYDRPPRCKTPPIFSFLGRNFGWRISGALRERAIPPRTMTYTLPETEPTRRRSNYMAIAIRNSLSEDLAAIFICSETSRRSC